MFEYVVKFKPFNGAFVGSTFVTANSVLDAQSIIMQKFPRAVLLGVVESRLLYPMGGDGVMIPAAVMVTDNRQPCEVIRVDFRAKKRIV